MTCSLSRALPAVALLFALACRSGPPAPAPLDTRHDACAFCRMAVSDRHFAAQLVAPGEEPLFFDDLGCLARHLAASRPRARAVAWVADHRTGEWVRTARAVYTRSPRLETPMGSHLVAHADAASRDADPAAQGGVPASAAEIFGPAGPPDGR
ncbi:nitrous oxide reductase accessory protein NosL [Anaeromyxobacter terrae]|uniref:nitrous oxide reductase accessory protein NosL n=1 Tax=Anaeromyxobacter terrae TaxID=2925406 RepID=UPI001F5A0668|nr:nitrous oxide reductase accessory protein NosL [Anaeromyxobacter sp. SG22]